MFAKPERFCYTKHNKYAESSPVSVCGEFFASAAPHVSGAKVSNLCEAETKQQIAS